MPKKLNLDNAQSFGERMTVLRIAAGYSQRDLARETGISQRMIAYYEFSQVEKMDQKEKRQILQFLDTFIEKEQLKQKIQSG